MRVRVRVRWREKDCGGEMASSGTHVSSTHAYGCQLSVSRKITKITAKMRLLEDAFFFREAAAVRCTRGEGGVAGDRDRDAEREGATAGEGRHSHTGGRSRRRMLVGKKDRVRARAGGSCSSGSDGGVCCCWASRNTSLLASPGRERRLPRSHRPKLSSTGLALSAKLSV